MMKLFRFKKIFFIYLYFSIRAVSKLFFLSSLNKTCKNAHTHLKKKRGTAHSLFIFTFKRASLKKYIFYM